MQKVYYVATLFHRHFGESKGLEFMRLLRYLPFGMLRRQWFCNRGWQGPAEEVVEKVLEVKRWVCCPASQWQEHPTHIGHIDLPMFCPKGGR